MLSILERRVIINDKIIYLSITENKILNLLFNNKGKIITYDELAEEIYYNKCDKYYKKAIRKHMALLRKKVGQYIKIKTVREVGYIVEEELK